TRTTDNDVDRTDRTTSTRIDSATLSNDRMSTGNPNDRASGRMTTGGTTGGSITTDNAGLDRSGTGTNTGTGVGTGTGIGTGTGTSGSGTGTGTGTGARGAGGAGGGGARGGGGDEGVEGGGGEAGG